MRFAGHPKLSHVVNITDSAMRDVTGAWFQQESHITIPSNIAERDRAFGEAFRDTEIFLLPFLKVRNLSNSQRFPRSTAVPQRPRTSCLLHFLAIFHQAICALQNESLSRKLSW